MEELSKGVVGKSRVIKVMLGGRLCCRTIDEKKKKQLRKGLSLGGACRCQSKEQGGWPKRFTNASSEGQRLMRFLPGNESCRLRFDGAKYMTKE